MKRLVFCFDGSWNRLDAPHPTNVLLTAQSVLPVAADGKAQVTFYDEGVGSEDGQGIAGGVFGAGLVKNLSDGYRFLIFNYAPSDEIHVFGFSRGAYTARSFVGLLATCGILDRRHAGQADEAVGLYKQRDASDAYRVKMLEFRRDHAAQICVSEEEDLWRAETLADYRKGSLPRLQIKYLAVWDTVGALGIPRYLVMADTINRQHQFHNVSLSPLVEFARHAVAIDEHRVDFEPTLWENLDALNTERGSRPDAPDAPYQQMWFAGTHGSVGGGGEKRGLSDAALDWIWDGARHAGLELDSGPGSELCRLTMSHREHLSNRGNRPGFDALRFVLDRLPRGDRQPGPTKIHEISGGARLRWRDGAEHLPEGEAYRPATLAALAGELDLLPEPSAPGEGPCRVHIVGRGETIENIALRYFGTAEAAARIRAANAQKLAAGDQIYAGQALRVPEDRA